MLISLDGEIAQGAVRHDGECSYCIRHLPGERFRLVEFFRRRAIREEVSGIADYIEECLWED